MNQLKVKPKTQSSSDLSPSFEVKTKKQKLQKYQTSNLRSISIVCLSSFFFSWLYLLMPYSVRFPGYLPSLLELMNMRRITELFEVLSWMERNSKDIWWRDCIPENQIITLFNCDATWTAIIEGFQKLHDNDNINKGDPIFICILRQTWESEISSPWLGGQGS